MLLLPNDLFPWMGYRTGFGKQRIGGINISRRKPILGDRVAKLEDEIHSLMCGKERGRGVNFCELTTSLLFNLLSASC